MADTKLLINCETGEAKEVALTAAEKTQRTKDAAEAEARQATLAQAAADRQAKLDAIRNTAGIPPAVRAAIADLLEGKMGA